MSLQLHHDLIAVYSHSKQVFDSTQDWMLGTCDILAVAADKLQMEGKDERECKQPMAAAADSIPCTSSSSSPTLGCKSEIELDVSCLLLFVFHTPSMQLLQCAAFIAASATAPSDTLWTVLQMTRHMTLYCEGHQNVKAARPLCTLLISFASILCLFIPSVASSIQSQDIL